MVDAVYEGYIARLSLIRMNVLLWRQVLQNKCTEAGVLLVSKMTKKEVRLHLLGRSVGRLVGWLVDVNEFQGV